MRHDPAALYRALLAPPRRRSRQVAPAAALAVLAAPAVVGVVTVGMLAERLAPWVVLGVVGMVTVLLLGLAELPKGHPAQLADRPVARSVTAAALLAERVVLLAACAAVVARLLAAVVPALAGAVPALAVLAVALVLTARLVPWPEDLARRRTATVLAWVAAAVLSVVVLAGVGAAATGDLPDPPVRIASGWAPLPEMVTVGVAVALAGVVLQHALVPGGSRRLRVVRVGAAGLVVVAVLGVVAAGLAVGAEPPLLSLAAAGLGEWVVPWTAVGLGGGLLVAASSALSGSPRSLAGWPGAARDWSPKSSGRRGLVALTLLAAATVLLTAGDPARLVAAYAVVVLLLAVLVLLAGRRAWRERLEMLYQPAARRSARRGRVLTGVAATVAGAMVVLAAVRGWPALLAVAVASAMMWGVDRHDRELRDRLALTLPGQDRPLPTVVRAFVVVTALDRPAVRAVAYARAMRATSIEALTVPAGERDAATLRQEWAALDLPVPLVELAAPSDDPAAGVVEHVAAARRAEPDGLAVVYLPELAAGRRRPLLGGAPGRLRGRLLVLPGTVVTTVPWHTEKS